jgi:hypothetical protein
MRHLIQSLLPVTVILFGSSCSVLDPDSRLDELESHREQWRAADIQHYRMEFRASCFCGQEFTELVIVEVLQDTIRSVTVVRTDLPVEHMPIDAWLTVEELFAAVEEAILDDADELQVTYDLELGYPEFIFIDREELAIDEEVGYQVFDLEVVQQLVRSTFGSDNAARRAIR